MKTPVKVRLFALLLFCSSRARLFARLFKTPLKKKSLMRTVKITMLVAAAITTSIAHAQTNTFPTTGNAGVGTLAPAANLQVIGTSRFGAAANYGSFDGIGNLSFTGTSGYRVSGNRYAFQYSGNPNYGLFFNSTNLRYEFRDGAALPVFYVGANDGNAVFTGGLRVSNSTLTNAGNIRWTGTERPSWWGLVP